jgi:hypothetical protein
MTSIWQRYLGIIIMLTQRLVTPTTRRLLVLCRAYGIATVLRPKPVAHEGGRRETERETETWNLESLLQPLKGAGCCRISSVCTPVRCSTLGQGVCTRTIQTRSPS